MEHCLLPTASLPTSRLTRSRDFGIFNDPPMSDQSGAYSLEQNKPHVSLAHLTSSREIVIKAGTRRGDQPESMLLRQSRRSRRFRSNSYDCGDPKESTVPTRVAQSSRPSLSVGEPREAPFDSQEEPQPRVRTKQSSLPPKTSDLAEPTSEQDWRSAKINRLFEGKGSGTDAQKNAADPMKRFR